MELWVHKKTGTLYMKMYDAIDVTNSRDGIKVVVYANEQDMVFVREKKEFEEKFYIKEPII